MCFALVATAGCNLLKEKKDKILWSCTDEKIERGSLSGNRQCTDAYVDTRNCYTNEKKSDGPCKHDDAIAGCRHKDGDYVEWYYGFSSADDVGKVCLLSSGTTVMPGGGVVTVKTQGQRDSEELKKYMDESGPKAKATLATVAAIAAKFPAPTGKVNLEGLKGDVLLVHKEDLGNLESPKQIDYRVAEAGKLAACSRLLNGRKLPSDQPYELSYCAKNPIIAIVSVTSYAPPTATGSSVSGKTKTTHVKKGTISGDAFFFRTDNGKFLGSTTVGASNDDSSVTAPQIMTERLLEKWPGALHSQIKQAAPGMTNINFTLKK
jgi:hypothetical protein